MFAAYNNSNPEVLTTLLEAGADVNAKNDGPAVCTADSQACASVGRPAARPTDAGRADGRSRAGSGSAARPTDADLGRSRLKKVAPAYLSGARRFCAREEWRHTRIYLPHAS